MAATTQAQAFYALDQKEVYKELKTDEQGLNSGEATRRKKAFGPNELLKAKGTSPLKIFLNQFKSFIIYILFGSTVISAVLGEWVDAIVIFIILVLNAVMGFIQEYKAEKSIEALQRLASLKAVVIRDGKEKKVDAKELVPGDILLLETGEKVPADARLIEAVNLKAQEGALTGESVSVEKKTEKLKDGLSLGDQANMVFSGTILTGGRGKAIITHTGMQTQIGKIADLIQSTKREQTPLQKKLNKLGRTLGIVTLAICALVFITGVLRGGTSTENIMDVFLAAVALAVAAIPEGLPAVITIALGIGVQKMIKKNALIRKLPSVETLGAVTVICTDKTGTLTHNQMTVKHVYTNGKSVEVTGAGYEPHGEIKGDYEALLLKIGALCNDAKHTKGKKDWGVIGDPTEGCLLVSAKKAGFDYEELQEKQPRVDELGFDSSRKMMTTLYKEKGKLISYTKGAADNILERSNRILKNGKVVKLTAEEKKKILEQNKEYSTQALRVLGFAYNEPKNKQSAEKEMIFVGLQAMIDPPREEAKEAIKKCKAAGIKVIMITGDHLDTATAIAKELGIQGKSLEGKDIENIDLKKEVSNIGVFARVNPEHKLKIVEALKKNGEIVAMTGDGVNDAPALKQADIGVAMGITGTDVSKEASSMILTDDNFASIVSAVEEGRSIYDNIKKFVNYLLSSNFGEVLILFLAMAIGFRLPNGEIVLPLTAIQILWVNLVTDGLPALALGVDPADPKIMHRKPRNPKDHIVSKNMLWNIIVIGIMMTIAVLFVFKTGLSKGAAVAQTKALTMLVVLEIVRLEMIRSQYNTGFFSNKWLTLSLGGVLALQLLIIYTPARHIFGLAPLGLVDWMWILMAGAAMLVLGKLASLAIKHYTHQTD